MRSKADEEEGKDARQAQRRRDEEARHQAVCSSGVPDSPRIIAAYISQVLADGDVEEVKRAIGYVTKAKGMTQVARDAGIGRVALYKALSHGTQMRADTVLNLLRAVGLELRAIVA